MLYLFYISWLWAQEALPLKPHEERYNQAAVAMNNSQPQECLNILKTVPKEHLHSELFLNLGYICAVSASHLKAADALREELGILYLPPNALDIHHAWMLRNQKRYEEALEALRPEGWQSQKHKEVGTTLQAILYADLQDWPKANLLAGSPFVDTQAQLFIAQQLKEQGELEQAKALYDVACAKVEHQNLTTLGCASIITLPSK